RYFMELGVISLKDLKAFLLEEKVTTFSAHLNCNVRDLLLGQFFDQAVRFFPFRTFLRCKIVRSRQTNLLAQRAHRGMRLVGDYACNLVSKLIQESASNHRDARLFRARNVRIILRMTAVIGAMFNGDAISGLIVTSFSRSKGSPTYTNASDNRRADAGRFRSASAPLARRTCT